MAFTLKLNCKYAIKNRSRCYYLRTRNASLEWIPCRSIVHQIVRDLEISTLKKVFFKGLQTSEETNCAEVSFLEIYRFEASGLQFY